MPEGTYTAYAFGNAYALRALFPVAGVSNTDECLTIEGAGKRWVLPTRVRADWREAAYWLGVWRRQFVTEAFKTKQILMKEVSLLQSFFYDIVNSIKRRG